jgi:hypothetical protein
MPDLLMQVRVGFEQTKRWLDGWKKSLLCSNECGPSIIIIAALGVCKEIVALLVHVEDGLEGDLLAYPCVTGVGMLQSFLVEDQRVLSFCVREYTGHGAVLRDEPPLVIGGIQAVL